MVTATKKFTALTASAFVLFLWNFKLVASSDDLLLMWNVPKESQFLGFCSDNERDGFSVYVVAPEMPKSLFSQERLNEEGKHTKQARSKAMTLTGYNGFRPRYLSPECVFDRSPYGIESLFLPSESIAGEVLAILGYPFTENFVLKYEPSHLRAQIRRSSIEVRQPLRSYTGRQSLGRGLVLDSVSLQGKNTDCRLTFCADVDLVLGTEIWQELTHDHLGHQVSIDLLTNSSPTVLIPVTKTFAFIREIDVDNIKIDKACCLFDDQCQGIQIGWGLLQDLDFELEFHGKDFEFRVYETPKDRNKIFRKGELTCNMVDGGLQIVEIADWSTLSKYLMKNDIVHCAGDQIFPGVIRRNAEIAMLSQRFGGGSIEVDRKESKIKIDVPKDPNSFVLRDQFLFNIKAK